MPPARFPETGIVFLRTEVTATDPVIPARWDLVEPSALCTRLTNEDGTSVSTVEHVMAALSGLGIHNAIVALDGPEVPILDGSAAPFVRAILAAGLAQAAVPLRAWRVVAPVEVRQGQAVARLAPHDALRIDFAIDFAEAAIGAQELGLEMRNGAFVRELCDSRTFCLQADVDAMRARGLALGGSVRNAVVFDRGRVLSPGGLRHRDEPVRHKMLDALGDLALAGAPILGRYSGLRAGHALTNALLRRAFATPGAMRRVTLDRAALAKQPGAGVVTGDLALCA